MQQLLINAGYSAPSIAVVFDCDPRTVRNNAPAGTVFGDKRVPKRWSMLRTRAIQVPDAFEPVYRRLCAGVQDSQGTMTLEQAVRFCFPLTNRDQIDRWWVWEMQKRNLDWQIATFMEQLKKKGTTDGTTQN